MKSRSRLVVLAGLGVWNVIVNRFLPARHYVPANLGVTAAVLLTGRGAGLAPADVGLGSADLGRGLRWGLGGGAVVGASVVAASCANPPRQLFDDARAAAGHVGYETLVRIPLGTVVLEEAAFRGVLPALIDGGGARPLSWRSSAWFGLWHIIPTLNTLDINGVKDRPRRVAAVAAGVVATAAGGLVFDRLRLRSRSLLAPALVHWAANAASYAIAARRHSERDKPPE